LEIKTDDGKPSKDQLDCLAACEAAGAVCAVGYGLDACLKRLEGWQILRGKAA
jgi:hypothetical protein